MSNISDFLSFLSETDILFDAKEEVLHSSELDICDEHNGSWCNDGSWDDDEAGPSSRFMTTDRASKASKAAEVSGEGKGESGRDDGGSDSIGKCSPSKHVKCAKRVKGNRRPNGVQILLSHWNP